MGWMESVPMHRTRLSAIAAIAVMAGLLLSACSSATTDVLSPTVSVSIGQQLIDLKKAKDAGALSEKEYQAQVKRLIDSVR
jgi:hypothetical protein